MNRKTILLVLLAVAVAATVYYFYKYSYLFERRTAATALKAYQLYTAQEKQKGIKLYFGDPSSDGFKTCSAKIFDTQQNINQVKQALMLLLQDPQQGCVRVIPDGTMLREAYADSNGILYIDFTQEISVNHPGGSTAEYLTVYSILNTVFSNFTWVNGIRLFVDGKETPAFAGGHISIDGIFRPEDITDTDEE